MLDFTKEYDVAICGAGIAGIAAALASARQGCKTCLIEKQMSLGGLATSGLIFIYLPLCDGNGTQVTFGIAEELLLHSLKYGPFDLPEDWGGKKGGNFTLGINRYQCCFSPAGYILELDKLLKDAGVDLWLDTLVTDAETKENNRIESIEVCNVSGKGKIKASTFIDASGNASLIRRAGGKVFQELNYVTPWVIEHNPNCSHFFFSPNIHVKNIGAYDKHLEFKGDTLTGKGNTQFMQECYEILRNYYDAFEKEDPEARVNTYPLTLPGMVQFRKAARIDGIETLSTGQQNTYFDNSVGLYGAWHNVGHVWETPYGTLLPKDVSGVLAAGRCISTSGDAWEAFRVIPAAAMTGEIAGIAAAMAHKEKCDPREINLENLRATLRKNNFKFHLDEVFPK